MTEAPSVTTTPGGAGSARPRSPTSIVAVLLALLSYLAATGPSVLARVLWIEAFETDGPSMEPTLLDGDRFLLDRTAVGLFLPGAHQSVVQWGAPEVGDVVVVYSPMDEVEIVKRVIGVAGDRVSIEAGTVLLNGTALGRRELEGCAHGDDVFERDRCFEERVGDRTWRVSHTVHERDVMEERVVPEGHVFVLGDHRDRSNDSRNPAVGMIPLSRVVGVVWARYWSEQSRPLGVLR